MQTFTAQQAQAALAAQQSNAQFSVQQIRDLLGNASVTFANVTFVTQQQHAAKFKNVIINKVTSANIILCSNISAHTSVYANKVRKTALQYSFCEGMETHCSLSVFEPQPYALATKALTF